MIRIKNKEIVEVIKLQGEFEEKNGVITIFNNPYDSMSIKQTGISILWGFTTTLREVAEDKNINVRIDLTYKTVSDFMLAAYGVFCSGMGSGSEYSFDENIMILKKTIAAYLMILAMNENDAQLYVERVGTSSNSINDSTLWAGLSIKLCGKLCNVDLLKIIDKDVKVTDKSVIVHMENIIKAYRDVINVNLEDYGVESLEIVYK